MHRLPADFFDEDDSLLGVLLRNSILGDMEPDGGIRTPEGGAEGDFVFGVGGGGEGGEGVEEVGKFDSGVGGFGVWVGEVS